MGRISFLVEKVPDEIKTYPISPSIYLIERRGILIQIEKALIEKGFENELRFTKDELEMADLRIFLISPYWTSLLTGILRRINQ